MRLFWQCWFWGGAVLCWVFILRQEWNRSLFTLFFTLLILFGFGMKWGGS